MFTDGKTPYSNYKTNHEVWMKVNKGERLAKPASCPDDVWEKIFAPCWQKNYKKRPTFQELVKFIQPRLKLERLGAHGMDSDAGSDTRSYMGGVSNAGSDTDADQISMVSRANSSMSSFGGLEDFDPAWFVNAPKQSSSMFELEMLA